MRFATGVAPALVQNINYYQTAGKREGGSPDFTFGGRLQGTVGLLERYLLRWRDEAVVR